MKHQRCKDGRCRGKTSATYSAQRHPRHPQVLAPRLPTNYRLLDPNERVVGSPARERKSNRNILARRVIMLPPMVVLSAPTKKDTLVSFNRVIIVASGQISRIVLNLGVEVSIDAKEEMQPEQQ